MSVDAVVLPGETLRLYGTCEVSRVFYSKAPNPNPNPNPNP